MRIKRNTNYLINRLNKVRSHEVYREATRAVSRAREVVYSIESFVEAVNIRSRSLKIAV